MGVQTEKMWFIDLAGKQEGPYSVLELKRDLRITPDTLVWREGMAEWTPIKEIPELQELFKEEEEEVTELELKPPPIPEEEVVLDIRKEPPYFLLWLLIAAIIISYVLYVFWN